MWASPPGPLSHGEGEPADSFYAAPSAAASATTTVLWVLESKKPPDILSGGFFDAELSLWNW
ncbi:hypothetical protein [Hymenobacter sp. BT188]|uniref:hypothetical protein n=1 Tax=Hymenobacter sp. BT188 TaxID=2763504 RepID=UPI0016517146|nr:hypothetical protein [Hymenobacter sp. BT188]